MLLPWLAGSNQQFVSLHILMRGFGCTSNSTTFKKRKDISWDERIWITKNTQILIKTLLGSTTCENTLPFNGRGCEEFCSAIILTFFLVLYYKSRLSLERGPISENFSDDSREEKWTKRLYCKAIQCHPSWIMFKDGNNNFVQHSSKNIGFLLHRLECWEFLSPFSFETRGLLYQRAWFLGLRLKG